jgi:O-antigen/teichoic acid export membrane protein
VARLTRGGFAVLDQGLYSGANFLISVLLARWLSGEQYGAFTVAFSMMFLVTAVHSALLTEPMLVFGAGKYGDRFPGYLRLLIDGHFLVALAASAVSALAAAVLWRAGSAATAGTLGGLALAVPFVLLAALARRAFYVVRKPGWSAIGSALYLLIVIGGIYAVNRRGALSGGTSMVVMGISGALTSLALLLILRPRLDRGSRRELTRRVLEDHWRYGRWAIGSSLLLSSSGAIYYLVVTAFLTLESVAVLRAVQNLFAPISQFSLSITWFLVPWCAKRAQRLGPGWLTGDAVRISAGLAAAATLYLLLMVFAGPALADLLYAGRYAGQARLIAIVAFAQIVAALGGGVHVALRASGRSDLLFVGSAAGVSFGALANLALVALWGFDGASAGIGLFALATAIAAWWLWVAKERRRMRGPGSGAAPQGSGTLL